MSVRPYAIEYRTADGTAHTSTVHARSATDAVALMSAPLRETPNGNRSHVLHTARIAVTPHALRLAAWRVARDLAKSLDEPAYVRPLMDEVRNTLRLPEEPPCPGAYPLDDEGSDLDTAYRVILEATAAELDEAFRLHTSDSVRPR